MKELFVSMSQTLQYFSSAEQKRPTRINPRILLLALGMFALGTDAFVVAGVLPVISRETGITEGLAGQLVTAFSLTYGLGAPILAVLVGRWSPNRVLIGALGLFCLANVGSALAPTFSMLLLSRILVGCFAAIYGPLAYTVGTSLAPPEKRGQALALVIIGLTVATAVGLPLGTWVGEHFGWRMSFGLVAVLAGIAVLALLVFGLPGATTTPVLSLRARMAPITQPRLLLALLPSLLWNLGAYTVYTYIAPLLQHTLPGADISGLLLAFGLGAVGGTLSGGRIADRFGGSRPLVLFVVALIIVEVMFSLVTATLPGALLALFLLGLLVSILFIPQQYRLLRLAPEHANVILALNNSMFYLGIAGGSALGGLALRTVAVTRLGWIGAGCVLISLLLLAFSLRLHGRQAQMQVQEEREVEKVEEVMVVPE
jgi:predicted MFS family arabinose efflux permease